MLSRFVAAASRKVVKPVVAIPQRFMANSLPLDYSNVHLHNPYELFDAATSDYYDPPVTNNKSYEQIKAELVEAFDNLDEDLQKARSAITDPVELEAFDNVFVPIFGKVSVEELSKPYSDDHMILDAMNDPLSSESIPRRYDVTGYYDAVVTDMFEGEKEDRIEHTVGVVVSGASCIFMISLALYYLNDYFEHIGEEHH